jgi:hypothetical protein
MSALLMILMAAIPEVPKMIDVVAALLKKYPEMTMEQIRDVVLTITGKSTVTFDDVLADVAADRAAHPVP